MTNLLGLYLNDNQLTGSIPPEIGNLTNLVHLSLSNNQLTGSIPSEIGNLTNLYYLDLRNNQLSGIIPDNYFVCQLGYSEGVRFSNNQFCPPYPICLNEEELGNQDTSNCD